MTAPSASEVKEVEMKLWLLRPVEIDGKIHETWDPWYDKAFGFVVRAESEQAARHLVASQHRADEPWDGPGEEGAEPWTDPTKTQCEELTSAGDAKVIIRDFAGA